MNRKGRVFTLVLFILIVLSAGVAFVSTVEEVTGQEQEQALLHVNLKGDDSLNSETKAPDAQGETRYVAAEYTELYGGRSNKQWVAVGTWASSARDSAFDFGGRVTFNIWYRLIQEMDYSGEPEFRFTLSADGTQIIQLAGPEGQDPGDDSIIEYTVSGNFDSFVLDAGMDLSLDIEYRAWEDCEVNYDNASYDSGFFVDSNFCMVFSYGGKDDKITTEVYDAWGANWDMVGYHIEISIDGTEVTDAGFITKSGNKYTVDQDEYQSTLIQWTLTEDLQKGQNVTIWIKYSPADVGEDRGFEKGFEIGSGGGGGGGGGGGSGNGDDDDDDDNTMIYAAVGSVGAAVAVVGLVLFVKKRGGSEEEEDYDEDEEWDEEDEDYDEDDEMDYE